MATLYSRSYLGVGWGVWFLEERPYSWLDALPAVELAGLVAGLQAELLHYVLLGRLVRVQVQTIQRLQRLLRVAVRRVRHPATRLHLQQHPAGHSNKWAKNSVQWPHRPLPHLSPPRQASPFWSRAFAMTRCPPADKSAVPCCLHSPMHFNVGTTPKLPLPLGDPGTHLIHGSVGPLESTRQTASRSVQPLL